MQTKQHIFSRVQGKDPSIRSINDIDQNYIEKWLQVGGPNGKPVPKSDLYYKNLNVLGQLASEQDAYTNRLNNIYEYGFKNLTEEEKTKVKAIDNSINSISNIMIRDDKTGSERVMTSSELSKGISDGSIKYTPAKKGWWDVGASNRPQFRIGENTYSVTPNGNTNLLSAYTKIKTAQDDPTYNKFYNNVKEYANTPEGESLKYAGQRARYYTESNADKILNSTISNIFPEYNVQQTGVGLSTNNQGDVYYALSTKGQDGARLTESELEDIKNNMTAKGYETEVVGSEGGGYELRVKGIKNSVTNNLRTFNRQQALIADEASSYQGTQTRYETGAFTTNNSDTKFWITKSFGLYYLNVEGLDDPLPETYNDPTDAIAKANILTANNEAFLTAYKQATNY
jgi:hypothetical protein